MTLVLTELSPSGISMVADSAVTYTHTGTGLRHVFNNAALKLQAIPYLNAGISCWGMGTINGISTDKWLENFINTHTAIGSLKDFADELAKQLNAQIPTNPNPNNARLGFHLAGYESYQGFPTPSFYHIHEGASTTLQARGIIINQNQFNANHDVPPDVVHQIFAQGVSWITRNGDYLLYANIFGLLENFFKQLTPLGVIIPNTQNLSDRAEYLVFQIRTMSELYRLSNLIPGIGGGIHYLTIAPSGIHSVGVKYF